MASKTKAQTKPTVEILNMEPTVVSIDKVKAHPKDPRNGDLPAIRRSIREHGFYGSVVAQSSTSHILVGNQRWAAAKKEGLRKIPVIWVDVDDDLAMRILLVDNKTSDRAGWDHQALAALFQEWRDDDVDLTAIGWEDWEVDPLLKAEWPGTIEGPEEGPEDAGETAERDSQRPPQRRPGADPSKASVVMTKDQYDLLAEVRREMMRVISEDEELEDGEVIEALCRQWLASREARRKKASAKR